MSSTTEPVGGKPKLGTLPFVFGGASFIPLIGVLFGVWAVLYGLISGRAGGKKLALVGAAGIGFSVVLYGGLFYFGFVQRGGIYDGLRAKLAQNELNSLVQSVEFYKLRFGEYPDSLAVLKSSLPKNSFEAINLYDPRAMHVREQDRYFWYRKVDAGRYYLRGVAADGQPFSPGALIPQVATAGTRLGLLTEPPAGTGADKP
jgi:hypothetical protein